LSIAVKTKYNFVSKMRAMWFLLYANKGYADK